MQQEGRTLREGHCDCNAQGKGQRSEMLHRQAEPGRHDKKEFKSNPTCEESPQGSLIMKMTLT